MNTALVTLDRPSRTQTVTTFSVDLVDGSGLDVAGEPVTALIRHEDGAETVVRQTTDAGGRARFVETHESTAIEMMVTAGRETLGPLRPPAQGTHLVIEM